MSIESFVNKIKEPETSYLPKDDFKEFKAFLSKKEIGFIDSGFQEITTDLFLLRVHASIWKENKKIKDFHAEFLVKDNNIHILKNSDFAEFIELSINKNLVESCESAGMIFLLKHLEAGSLLIRDGSFDNDIFQNVIDLGLKKGILVMGLSKSTELKLNKKPLTDVLFEQGPKSTWFYKDANKEYFTRYIVRLHKFSNFAFRLDIPKIPEVIHPIEILASNCVDPTFLGYPYGLIDVDNFARVSNEDAEYYKVILETQYKLSPKKDAHKILDNIKF